MAQRSIDPILPYLADAEPTMGGASPDALRRTSMQKRVISSRLTRAQVESRLAEQAESHEATFAKFFVEIITGAVCNEHFERECIAVRNGRISLKYKALAALLREQYRINLPLECEELANMLKATVYEMRKTYRSELREMKEKTFSVSERVRAAFDRLNEARIAMIGLTDDSEEDIVRERAAVELINLVRVAAARVVPAVYGEGIHDTDLDEMEGVLLSFAKSLPRETDHPQAESVGRDLGRLFDVLRDYNGDAVADDLELVDAGCRVIIDLVGTKHICGLFAQLDIFVVLKRLLSVEEFADQMERIAVEARELHDDPGTNRLRRWMRRVLQKNERLPSPLRLSSYCLGNAIFRLIDACLANEFHDLSRINSSIQLVKQFDGGFEQLPWYRLAYAATIAERSGDASDLANMCRKLGRDKVAAILTKIRKHFEYDLVIEVATKHVVEICEGA